LVCSEESELTDEPVALDATDASVAEATIDAGGSEPEMVLRPTEN
jgi:hypothetical protein